MGSLDRKQELFANIVHLRRLGRLLPGDQDLAALRASLEDELGQAVSRRFAARALGVSHTALERWIRSGDLPVIHTPSGRLDIPVQGLLGLYEELLEEHGDEPPRYVLTPVIQRQRQAAERLNVKDLTESAANGGHARATARSLAYHRAIAKRLRRATVEEARHVLYRWRKRGHIDDRYAEQWERILDQPVPEIRRLIVEPTPEAADLRQNSPFAGLLSEPERSRVLREVR